MSLDKPGDILYFDELVFTTDYYDKEGDNALEVLILSLPQYGLLKFNKKAINQVPFSFNISEVNKLSYIRISSQEYEENINFKTSDNNPNKLYSEMATMTINVNAKENEPPTIGDNTIVIEYGETKVFNSDDFTTNTTPPYSDPEGNPPYKLKILSLPSNGKFQLNGIDITINQEILFTDIEDGLLQAFGSNADIDGETINFNFTISDTGSQQYATP